MNILDDNHEACEPAVFSSLCYFEREPNRQTNGLTAPTTLLGLLLAPFCLPVLQHYPYGCSLLIALDPAERRGYTQGLEGVFGHDGVLFLPRSAPPLLYFALYFFFLLPRLAIKQSVLIWLRSSCVSPPYSADPLTSGNNSISIFSSSSQT